MFSLFFTVPHLSSPHLTDIVQPNILFKSVWSYRQTLNVTALRQCLWSEASRTSLQGITLIPEVQSSSCSPRLSGIWSHTPRSENTCPHLEEFSLTNHCMLSLLLMNFCIFGDAVLPTAAGTPYFKSSLRPDST